MKGIILAGGKGTRLYPSTKVICKQLLPVYDKPMIYYPISVLMLAGITEILIISTPQDINSFKRLLGDGSNFGIQFSYEIQHSPDGLAQAFILGESFIGQDDVCLVLGDNLFYGAGLQVLLENTVNKVKETNNAVVFGTYVKDPERYGVAEINNDNKVVSIEEKPSTPKSNFAVVGLYFYPNDVIRKAHSVKPSKRGELEITSVNEIFLNENRLYLEKLSRGYAWLDTGTHESLSEATEFIKAIEKRTGLKVGCLEEIAFKMGYIDLKTIISNIEGKKGDYFQYVKSVIN